MRETVKLISMENFEFIIDKEAAMVSPDHSKHAYFYSVLTQVYYQLQWFYLEEQDTGGSVVNMSSTSTDVSESERAYRTNYVPPYFRSRTQLLYFAVPTPGNHLSFWAVP
ncbi:SKP1/BTB/POZ domain protein [Raphanus sativus]|nr:SKP1/BTB/POZ domain protein [Raphanus sativus]